MVFQLAGQPTKAAFSLLQGQGLGSLLRHVRFMPTIQQSNVTAGWGGEGGQAVSREKRWSPVSGQAGPRALRDSGKQATVSQTLTQGSAWEYP